MTYKVNLVMATFNRLDATNQTIPNIRETTKNSSIPYMLTVVDNGSTDGTVDYLTEMYNRGEIDTLILLKENVGVSKAQNIGWKLFEGTPYYAKIDNDVLFHSDTWLDDLIHVFDNAPEIGVLGYDCEPAPPPSTPINNGKVSFTHKQGNVGGACHFVSNKINKVVGFWCPDYDKYGEEDADYGVRVAVAKYKNCYMLDRTVMEHLPEEQDEYRSFKDEQREENLKSGLFQRITSEYRKGDRPVKIKTNVLNEISFNIMTHIKG